MKSSLKLEKVGFYFDEGSHTYYLDGKPLTGVTTVLQCIAKPALIQWAANMCADYIKENYSGELTDELLKEARTAHRKKKEDAGQKGTDVHSLVENWIKTGVSPEEPNKQFQNFVNWAQENKVKFLTSEQRVYSKKHWYAGTLDFICEIDGKKYIGDLKTSSGIYGREYFFQCAGYRQALEEMGETDFHGSIIVRCGKKGDFETKESFDYETDRDGFNAALRLYRILNNK
jgi:hypothetical protein